MRDNNCSKGFLKTMKQIFKAGLVMLALFGLSAMAQDWYHDRLVRFRGEEWRGHIFEHVRTDLEHIWSAGNAAPRERKRLDNTKRELTDLQAQLQSGGRYNEGELNDVIDSLVKSANDQRLAPRDRDVIGDDLNRLRDYRAHHDTWRH
jgi:hypothetical protein